MLYTTGKKKECTNNSSKRKNNNIFKCEQTALYLYLQKNTDFYFIFYEKIEIQTTKILRKMAANERKTAKRQYKGKLLYGGRSM